MAPADAERTPLLTHDEAFSVLGDETRLRILQVLGEAGEPVVFSELFELVGYEDSSNFNYHLDKLVGHFVAKTNHGYRLRQAGRRINEAILSGAVTNDRDLQLTELDEECPLCSAAIKVGYRQERVEMYCTECSGIFEADNAAVRHLGEDGYLGHMSLPPVGVTTRNPAEILETAWTWKHLDVLADSSGVCSRCSAPLDHRVTVCEEHSTNGRSCDRCQREYATQFIVQCTNCTYEMQAIAPGVLLANTELLDFLTDHGINPITPDPVTGAMETIANYREEICSIDPFKGKFTFTVDEEALTVTLNEELTVVEAVRRPISDPG